MNVLRVDDIDDPRIAPYRNLHRSNLTRCSGQFIVESPLLVERLTESVYPLESILVDERRRDLVPATVGTDVPIFVTAPGLVEKIVGFNFHRGILACGRRVTGPQPWERLQDRSRPVTAVVAVEVQDPTNLGGIFRNCAAFGADGVLLSRHCADPLSRRVLRVSMGAVFRMPYAHCPDLPGALARCRDEFGLELVATVLGGAADVLDRVSPPPRVALLFGNEGHGLPDEVCRMCQRTVTLPMAHQTDSLNAAVAAGVFLYHFTRGRPASVPGHASRADRS